MKEPPCSSARTESLVPVSSVSRYGPWVSANASSVRCRVSEVVLRARAREVDPSLNRTVRIAHRKMCRIRWAMANDFGAAFPKTCEGRGVMGRYSVPNVEFGDHKRNDCQLSMVSESAVTRAVTREVGVEEVQRREVAGLGGFDG